LIHRDVVLLYAVVVALRVRYSQFYGWAQVYVVHQRRQFMVRDPLQLVEAWDAKRGDIPESDDNQNNQRCKTANIHCAIVLSLPYKRPFHREPRASMRNSRYTASVCLLTISKDLSLRMIVSLSRIF